MTDVDVVIVSWAKNDLLLKETHLGLKTLFVSEKPEIVRFHAIVIESNPEVSYDNVETNGHTVKTIYPEDKEFGYHKYLNIGVRAGQSTYVVLCNSDLRYGPGWASAILAVMQHEPDILSASPWCPLAHGKNRPKTAYTQGYLVRKEMAGWCIFQQRKVYDHIGELDERFKFWYCDNDYAKELQVRGLRHCLVTQSTVTHHNVKVGKTGSSLHVLQFQEYTTGQLKVFNEKWAGR